MAARNADTESHAAIIGSERALKPGSRLIGPADPRERIEITLRLRSQKRQLPDPDKIGALPPKRRRYLSREAFAATYGAAPGDIAKVRAFARRNRLKIVSVDPLQRRVVLSGTVKALNAALQVKLMCYEHPDGNYRGRIGRIHVPAALAPVVDGIFGLDNRRQARPHLVVRDGTLGSGAGGASSFTAIQVAELYDFPRDVDGRGQCIGILEFGGGYRQGDLNAYFAKLEIPAPQVSCVSVDGATNNPGVDTNADGEVALDIQIAGAIASGAKIVVYFAPFTERGWVDALSAAVHDRKNKPSVISISWGYAEGERAGGFCWTPQAVNAVNQILQAAALMGVTVCAASGDDGSNDQVDDGHAHADFPASSPFILGCGGTRLIGSHRIKSETVWNTGANHASGGGISDLNPLPAWQKGIVPPSVNPGGRIGRGVPDVCGNADPVSGYQVFVGGKPSVIGGTSAVAPLWAGLLARINENLGTTVGYFNPLLYAKLRKSGALRDITKGDNDTTGMIGGYQAGRGWDACTGWGSPMGAKLLKAFGG